MASNVQAGTRGLSASDWIRLKRLRGSRNYVSDSGQDITNSTVRLEPETGRRVFTEFGTSKVRRPASFWTDFRASQTADYVLESQNANTKSRSLTANVLCNGSKQTDCKVTTYAGTDGSSVIKHNGLCITCKHEKRTNMYPLAQQPSCNC